MVAARPCGAALFLLVLAAGVAAWPGKKDDSIEAQLARWVIAKGGKLVRWGSAWTVGWLPSWAVRTLYADRARGITENHCIAIVALSPS